MCVLQIDNQLTGTLPTFLFAPGNSDSLEVFDVASNNLTGPLPVDYLAGMRLRLLSYWLAMYCSREDISRNVIDTLVNDAGRFERRLRPHFECCNNTLSVCCMCHYQATLMIVTWLCQERQACDSLLGVTVKAYGRVRSLRFPGRTVWSLCILLAIAYIRADWH